MSAMSLRHALSRGSSVTDGPWSAKCLTVLEEEPSFLGGAAASAGAGAFLLLDVAFEALKEILSHAGLGDEDIAAVRLVAHAAQIAERTQRIQGARDHRLRNAQYMGEAADGVRSRCQVDEEQKRHLAVGEVRLARPDIADQRLHPALESTLCHRVISKSRRLVPGPKPVRPRFVSLNIENSTQKRR